jgi:hypothetical protein
MAWRRGNEDARSDRLVHTQTEEKPVKNLAAAVRSTIKRPLRQPFTRTLGATLAAALIITVVGACGSSSSSTSSSASKTSTKPAEPTGTYAAKITHLGPASGTYTITIAHGGSVTVKRNASPTGGSSNVVRGNTLITANRCNGRPGGGVGRYTLHLTGRKLKFIRVKDPCTGRSIVLAHTFTRVG